MTLAGFPGRMGPVHFGALGVTLPFLSEPATVWIGDSITAGALAFSLADWCNFFSFGRLNHDAGYNFGVTGNKTTDVIARIATPLALNPVFVELLIGTNDVGAGGRLAPAVITDYQTIVDTILGTASVQALAVCTIMPRSGANALNTSQETQRQGVNTYIRGLPATNSKIILVDYDASSGWDPTTQSIDGLHPNNYGAFLLGKFNASAISSIINPTDVLASVTGNLHPNPTLTGTSGGNVGTGASGVVATSCQVRDNLTGGLAVSSKGTLGSFTSQDIAISGVVTLAGNVQFRGVTTVTTVAAQTYVGMAHVKITSGGNLSSLTMAFSNNNMFGSGTVTTGLNQDIEGVIRTGPVPISTTQSNAAFDTTASQAAGTLAGQIFQISRPVIKRIS